MAFEFHKDKERYFRMQTENAAKSIIPFIEQEFQILKGMKVLEIGCAEGGVLKAFIDKGCKGYGVELSPSRLKKATTFLEKEVNDEMAVLINKNIYDVDFQEEMKGEFDLIILKDVIEHIFDQNKLLDKLRTFLKPNGFIFFGFPPWQMPFGGHQQIARSKVLSKLPYYHLLPMSAYKGVLKLFKETPERIADLVEIKETGISIERFERICKENKYSINQRTYFLINPIYSYKFNLKETKQIGLIAKIPYIRNYLTTGMYYLVQKRSLN